jgi:hypothetical protein
MGSFDITFIESLVAVGVPRDRAQLLSEQLRQEIDGRYSLHAQVLATKRDLADVELKIMNSQTQMQERISNLETGLRNEINDVKLKLGQTNERIADTHFRIAESSRDTLKWILGFMVAQTGMLLAVFKLMSISSS